MSVCEVSTLLFKFDGFGDLSTDQLKPNQVSDATTGAGVWRDCPDDPRYLSTAAQDVHGNNWRLHVRIDYFYTSKFDENGDQIPNPDVADHEVSLWIHRERRYRSSLRDGERFGGSEIAEVLGYDVVSDVSIILRDADGEVVKERYRSTAEEPLGKIENLIKYSEVVSEENNILRDGSFVLEMEVKDYIDSGDFNLPRIPEMRKMKTLLETGEGADVEFKVGGTVLSVHKFILRMHAPVLASFFEKSGVTSAEIEGVQPEVLRFALKYIYGYGEPDHDFLLEHGDEIIDFADRYALIELKLEAEAEKVSSLTVNASNVVERILFAHQKNCALFKEYAVKMFVERYDDVVESDSFTDLTKSPELMKELVLALRPPCKKTPTTKEEKIKSKLSKLTVNELLGKLIARDLDADGTKDILVTRLVEDIMS